MPSVSPSEALELFRSAPVESIDVGQGLVAYRRVGSGPDVLFVHGWPVSSATFRQLLPHLAEHVTCHLIDLPGAGDSSFDARTVLTVDQHIATVRTVLDRLELDHVAVVGHDSGGLICRHAVAGDPRVRAMGLIDTEQPHGLSRRFRMFLAGRNLPGFGTGLGWIAGQPRLRRNRYVLGDAFADASLIDGEFEELFLEPLHRDRHRRDAAIRLLRSFDARLVDQLAEVHRRITVPVHMVWGREDRFFPVGWAEEMVGTFRQAELTVVDDAGLFAHEERPAAVADALLPTLAGS